MKRLLILVLCVNISLSFAQHLQQVLPEQVGLNSSHLLLADSVLNAEIKAKKIPGAVLAIVRHGKMAYIKSYGNRCVYPKNEEMTTETIFDMASCSKPIGTATCIMKLLEQGKLRLLDPVKNYIPEFKNWKQGTKGEETIRIIHLLTHTSGLPAYGPIQELEKKYGAPNPEGLMKYISTCKRDTAPEIRMKYSCLNFITLQNILQNITGESLKDYAKKNVFEPLGMYHTGYLPADSLLPIIAPTEKQKDGSVLRGKVHDPLARIMNGGISGNAGLFTCAEDLGIYVSMLLNKGEWNGKRILSQATVKAMTTIPYGFERFGRSLGWDLHSAYSSCNGDLFGGNTYGHTGYTGTMVVVDPDADLGLILLINSVHPEDGHSVVRLRSVISNIVAASIKENPRVYTDYYYKRISEFNEQPQISSKDIVMLGNSLTEGGGDWEKRLGVKNVINRGIVGDEILGVYDRLESVVEGCPQRIYLLIGINDISHNATKDSMVRNIQMVIEKIREKSPATELFLQSILPINEKIGKYSRLKGKTAMIPQINEDLRKLAEREGIHYVDLFSLFKEKNSNSMRMNLTSDGLHLTEEGYKVWCKAILKTL